MTEQERNEFFWKCRIVSWTACFAFFFFVGPFILGVTWLELSSQISALRMVEREIDANLEYLGQNLRNHVHERAESQRAVLPSE